MLTHGEQTVLSVETVECKDNSQQTREAMDTMRFKREKERDSIECEVKNMQEKVSRLRQC